MRRAAINAGVNLVDVTPALAGHQACDPAPWVNGVADRRRRRRRAPVRSCRTRPGTRRSRRTCAVSSSTTAGQLLLTNPRRGPARARPAGGGTVRRARHGPAGRRLRPTACARSRVTVGGLRNGDRVDLLVDGVGAGAGARWRPVPTARSTRPCSCRRRRCPTTVVVEVSSIDRNLTGSTVATIGIDVNQRAGRRRRRGHVDEDGAVVVDVLANDTDPDADAARRHRARPPPGHGHGDGRGRRGARSPGRALRAAARRAAAPTPSRTRSPTAGGLVASRRRSTVTVTCVNDAPVLTRRPPVTGGRGHGGDARCRRGGRRLDGVHVLVDAGGRPRRPDVGDADVHARPTTVATPSR